MNDYLSARSAGERHLVIYSRRSGNGPSPHMSAFLDLWLEREQLYSAAMVRIFTVQTSRLPKRNIR